MSKEKRSNIIISAALVIIICIAIAVVIFVNLPEEEQEIKTKGYINIIYGEQKYNYTINDLIKLDKFTGSGSLIKTGWLPQIKIEGPYNYTGVKITSLFNKFENPPDKYNISIMASDGRVTNYSYNEIMGNIEVYNESGNVTGFGGVTMILAYMKEGKYINDPEEGPLRIAFIDDYSITSSKLWQKMVISIEIIEN